MLLFHGEAAIGVGAGVGVGVGVEVGVGMAIGRGGFTEEARTRVEEVERIEAVVV